MTTIVKWQPSSFFFYCKSLEKQFFMQNNSPRERPRLTKPGKLRCSFTWDTFQLSPAIQHISEAETFARWALEENLPNAMELIYVVSTAGSTIGIPQYHFAIFVTSLNIKITCQNTHPFTLCFHTFNPTSTGHDTVRQLFLQFIQSWNNYYPQRYGNQWVWTLPHPHAS